MSVILYEKKERIAYITLNRSRALNALNLELLKELNRVLLDFQDGDELLVGIITGAGDRAFSTGADIKTLLPFLKATRGKPWAFPTSIGRGVDIWKPLVAAVNGLCLGGGFEIALACDLRIASDNASFALTDVNLGLIPGQGGIQRLMRLVPRTVAADMVLTGRSIDAAEAYRVGLVNRVVPLREMMTTAEEYAGTICRAAPLAVRAAKQAMVSGAEMALMQALELEHKLFEFLLGTEDFNEGINAFTGKREPVFKGE